MASSSSSFRYLFASFVLNFFLQAIAAEPNTAFFFKNFGEASNFESQLALYGDAILSNNSKSIQIASSGNSRNGMVIYKKPIILIKSNSGNMVSFSNYFVFSIQKGKVLAFMGILGKKKMESFYVEFDAFKDEMSIKVSNVSSTNLEVSSGEKLQSWIDYEASSKRLEVRLNKLGQKRPVDSLVSYPIDISIVWKDRHVTVGLSSSDRCDLYSWSFRTRTVPRWMHSEPFDPEGLVEGEEVKVGRRSGCSLRVFSALIFGIGCGVLGAFLVVVVWTVVGSRRQVVVPEEFSVQREVVESKKFDPSVGKTIEDGKE